MLNSNFKSDIQKNIKVKRLKTKKGQTEFDRVPSLVQMVGHLTVSLTKYRQKTVFGENTVKAAIFPLFKSLCLFVRFKSIKTYSIWCPLEIKTSFEMEIKLFLE
jgi:hypothetical protein